MAGEFRFLPRNRLHRPEEFAAVMASRLRVSAGCFELRYLKRLEAPSGPMAGQARLGLIVPKRLAKRAVLRNLIKRLAREAFRGASPVLPPVDVVLRVVRPPLQPGREVDSSLRRSWRRSIDEALAGVAK
jgi:ribonuclease P protein component